jgi:hypothetical protein
MDFFFFTSRSVNPKTQGICDASSSLCVAFWLIAQLLQHDKRQTQLQSLMWIGFVEWPHM